MTLRYASCIVLLTVIHAVATSDCHVKYQQLAGHTACLAKDSKAQSVEMTASLKQHIVERHNALRGSVSPPATDMLKMSWDEEVAMLARKWADACDVRNGLNHDSVRIIPGRFSVGQNMAEQLGHFSFDSAMDMWWGENKDYVYGQVDQEGVTGHYTQMAWADSYKIGCAATSCDGGQSTTIVCNYAPTGNMGAFTGPYKTGSSCGDCQTCDSGVCDCGELECNMGHIKRDSCTCDCKLYTEPDVPTFMTGPQCTLDCSGSDIWYCGKPGFTDCFQTHLNQKCPHMCNVCIDPSGTRGTTSQTPAVAMVTVGDAVNGCHGELYGNVTEILSTTPDLWVRVLWPNGAVGDYMHSSQCPAK